MTPGPSRDINITPLIDIVLVLLIAFVVLVPVAPAALRAALPAQGGGAGAPALRLALDAGGLRVVGAPGQSLAEALARRPERVVLRVHPDLPFQVPARVLDELERRAPGIRVALVPGLP